MFFRHTSENMIAPPLRKRGRTDADSDELLALKQDILACKKIQLFPKSKTHKERTIKIENPIASGGQNEIWDLPENTGFVIRLTHRFNYLDTDPKFKRMRNMFEKEASYMQELNKCCPNVPPVIEWGEYACLTKENRTVRGFYMIQPKLRPFNEIFSKQLDIETAQKCVVDMLRSVACMHKHGLVHCDIKPANFMVDDSDDEPRVLLTDFGSARMDGQRIGPVSTAYVPPEMFISDDRNKPANTPGRRLERKRAFATTEFDCWSMGLSILEFLAHNVIERNGSEQPVIEKPKNKLFMKPIDHNELFDYCERVGDWGGFDMMGEVLMGLLSYNEPDEDGKRIGNEERISAQTALDMLVPPMAPSTPEQNHTTQLPDSNAPTPLLSMRFSKLYLRKS